ncbi:MAG: hypothetical protein K9L74_06020 [Candidatus Izimaplasma sp.]|nr:hypothetical protein [Candidatus Izimaplasma bacterium]
MSLNLGDYNVLRVKRITDFSYILTDDVEEVFLHHREATKELAIDDEVKVFLYYDKQRRVTASMILPKIDKDTPNFLTVVAKKYTLGCFLDMGLKKDLLLSKDDLPFMKKRWPEVGDEVFVEMNVSKNQLSAKPVSRFNIKTYLTPEKALEEGDDVEGYVQYIAEEGLVFLTKQGHYIFVYYKHKRKDYHLGEKASIKIVNVKTNGEYNGSLIKQKELQLSEDAKKIKEYLIVKGGVLPLGDKSDPSEIKKELSMSKNAFKRALGTLYKNKVVTLEPTRTILNSQKDCRFVKHK